MMTEPTITRADLVERIGAAIEQAPSVTMRVNKMRDDGLIYEIIVIDLPLDVGEEIAVLDAVGNPDEADASQARWQGIIAARAALAAIRDADCAVVPGDIDDALADIGLSSTASWLEIKGSALTVNREKMKRRYQRIVAAADLAKEDA